MKNFTSAICIPLYLTILFTSCTIYTPVVVRERGYRPVPRYIRVSPERHERSSHHREHESHRGHGRD